MCKEENEKWYKDHYEHDIIFVRYNDDYSVEVALEYKRDFALAITRKLRRAAIMCSHLESLFDSTVFCLGKHLLTHQVPPTNETLPDLVVRRIVNGIRSDGIGGSGGLRLTHSPLVVSLGSAL